ncbi:MAG: hypothetical protein ACXWLZ_05235 [Rhizomicrobium sp.]
MPYSIEGYEARADECVRLANQANDQLIRSVLLKLRQTYLHVAERLRQQGFESEPRRR